MPQKLDEMVKAIARENPDWPKDRVWATARSRFKKMKKAGGGMPAGKSTGKK